MLLIADSGSSKTLWVLLDKGKEIFSKITIGLNPNFIEDKWIKEAIESVAKECGCAEDIDEVFFYGSGCASGNNKKIILSGLKEFIPAAKLNVETDMLGAAIGVNDGNEGIACIMGTGSNAALYDGKKIIYNIPSFGYLFGDYGSGANLGKNLLQKYFDRELSPALREKFEHWKDFSVETILSGIYKNNGPNRFLATFSPFFFENASDIELRKIRLSSFSDFFMKQLNLIPDSKKYTLNFCGSVAYAFHEEINEIAHHFGYKTGQFFQSPMPGLVKFHSKK